MPVQIPGRPAQYYTVIAPAAFAAQASPSRHAVPSATQPQDTGLSGAVNLDHIKNDHNLIAAAATAQQEMLAVRNTSGPAVKPIFSRHRS
jgi:hypothetical protein